MGPAQSDRMAKAQITPRVDEVVTSRSTFKAHSGIDEMGDQGVVGSNVITNKSTATPPPPPKKVFEPFSDVDL